MTLNDFSAPIVSAASGDLLSAATLRGPASASFTAKDGGGGVYRVVVTADGKDVGSAVVPDSSGRCVQVDPADPNSFKWPQPCPLEVRDDGVVRHGDAARGDAVDRGSARGRRREPDDAGGAGCADGRASRDTTAVTAPW